MQAERRVKIVTTLGPAVAGRERLGELIAAGADVVRINAAHGSPDDRARLIEDVRAAARNVGKKVPILFDLRGLKIRTGPLAGEEPVPIARGSAVEVVPENVPTVPGRVGIPFPDLLDLLQPGSRILISDGLIELSVDKVTATTALCHAGRGGLLLSRQGVTLPGAPMRGGALTPDDRVDLGFAVQHGVDYIGLSFLSNAEDLVAARAEAARHGSPVPWLIAKIERSEALENVGDIATVADGLMVARGDLGVQLPPERVPRAQKEIISVANHFGVPVITATQMLESMITQPMATRAETSDVANAVWDGTDAVMLSAETAVGRFPLEAVRTMDRIIREAEHGGPIRTAAAMQPLPTHDSPALAFADAIAQAARGFADASPVAHIVVFTLTGAAVRRVAKYRPHAPIVAVAVDDVIARRLNLVWGVRSVTVPIEEDPDRMFRVAGNVIIEAGLAEREEYALIVGSLPMLHESGHTNLVHFRRLGT